MSPDSSFIHSDLDRPTDLLLDCGVSPRSATQGLSDSLEADSREQVFNNELCSASTCSRKVLRFVRCRLERELWACAEIGTTSKISRSESSEPRSFRKSQTQSKRHSEESRKLSSSCWMQMTFPVLITSSHSFEEPLSSIKLICQRGRRYLLSMLVSGIFSITSHHASPAACALLVRWVPFKHLQNASD